MTDALGSAGSQRSHGHEQTPGLRLLACGITTTALQGPGRVPRSVSPGACSTRAPAVRAGVTLLRSVSCRFGEGHSGHPRESRVGPDNPV